ncbi:MAG: ASKHA domain-containing protein [Christensenellaceae bacterium]
MENIPICKGECLFGKCPHKVCVKAMAQSQDAVDLHADMKILTQGNMPIMNSSKTGYGVAIDIGTTTVVVYLYDLEKMKCVSVVSRINKQASLGLDVISRIKFCGDHKDGLFKMHRAITDELNDLIEQTLKEALISAESISYAVITGNTTMLHLLASISPVSMGVLPFMPLSYFGNTINASEIDLNLGNAQCYLTPCMSAFVGGDISTALIATGFDKTQDICLLMDIGTNGEVAIGNKDFIWSTSTAAGPAFEGAHIKCGMAGVKGAINSVFAKQGKIEHTTIGNEKAQGICGSGLLDAVALMCEIEVIDETGRIDTEKNCKFVGEKDGEVVIFLTDDVYITQKDIRELQTAKAAVAAGVLSLAHCAEIKIEDVKRVYIAGGFGNYMDIHSAMAIGLLSKDFKEIISVGNAAGTGAIMTLIDDSYKENMSELCKHSKHVELGSNPYFMEKYVDCMYF